jgi:hypothetical protein
MCGGVKIQRRLTISFTHCSSRSTIVSKPNGRARGGAEDWDSGSLRSLLRQREPRGRVLEKAFYRMLGTSIGAVASIVMTDVFRQTRDLYVIAYSAWLAICVFAAGFLDGNRA